MHTTNLSMIAEKLERGVFPHRPKPIHSSLNPRTMLYDADLEEQRFDRTLKHKRSMSTMSCHSFDSNSSTLSQMTNAPAMITANAIVLPERKDKERWRLLYLNVRWRLWTVYRKLFTAVLVVNLAIIGLLCWRQGRNSALVGDRRRLRKLHGDILTAVSTNLTLVVAIRNEHVVNFLFRVFVIFASPTLPLGVRRRLAKVYCFGGVHSGCGVAATLWYILFVGISITDYTSSREPPESKATLVLTFMIWFLLVTIIGGAHPSFRTHLHDYFEVSHRIGGWLVLGFFWIQLFAFSFEDARHMNVSVGRALAQIPTFWMLLLITLLVIYPWARLRHLNVEVEPLSSHAVRVHFKGEKMPACRTMRISHNPLFETHSFATIPEPHGRPGYSMVVSRAGDWTSKIIENPPEKLWVKGVSAWGVLRIATMFKQVVIVATGSGIGPCLGLFHGFPTLPCRVLWSAKSPAQTYGKGIVDTVRRADANAVIIDTITSIIRPDMVTEARKLYKESNAEAVVVISNPKLTYEVVHTLECEGISAFGPIWDS
jgi:hypothetical protein